MRRYFFVLFVLPIFAFGQYWGERANEKGYEQSSIYFNSYYLNPYGIYGFADVSLGLFKDSYLKSYLNPAAIPCDSMDANQLYLDFRGDRKETAVAAYSGITPYYDYAYGYYDYYIDPRWYTVTRTEPEPLFSFAMNKMLSEDLYFSGSYQFVFKEETYYQTPTWIYNSRYGMDEKGGALTDNGYSPVIDRSAGNDEMHTKGHLLSATLAYRLSEKLNLGISANAVQHDRNGIYGKLRNDEYSTQENATDEWFSSFSQERENTYQHLDLAAGIQYKVNETLNTGLKLSYLDGKSDQEYIKHDSSLYEYDWSDQTYSNYHSSTNTARTDQNWMHDGTLKSAIFNLEFNLPQKRSINFYYKYDIRDIDLSNYSAIFDTSSYEGDYNYTNYSSEYHSVYKLSDSRYANGSSKMDGWQAMLTFHWLESKRTRIKFGLFFSDYYYKKQTNEPVISSYLSSYEREYIDDGELSSYSRFSSRYENKILEWRTSTEKQMLQIPISMEFDFNDNWTLMLAVNRKWEYWHIEESTTAYFAKRTKNDNGVIEEETNFGERWTEPNETISEDDLAFISGLTIKIAPKFQIQIMASPEFEPTLQISQWWLGFRAGL